MTCKDGHTPEDIEFQCNGPEILVTAYCKECGLGLEHRVQDSDWETCDTATGAADQ